MATKKTNSEQDWPAGDQTYPAPTMDAIRGTLSEFMDTACVDRVYGQPVSEGGITIIPTAEVLVGLGFGLGFGGGRGPTDRGDPQDRKPGEHPGSGGGGGGCGRTLSRPVAVVVVSPDGIQVEPVVDVTKIAIASITAAGFMMATLLGILSPKQMVKQMRGE